MKIIDNAKAKWSAYSFIAKAGITLVAILALLALGRFLWLEYQTSSLGAKAERLELREKELQSALDQKTGEWKAATLEALEYKAKSDALITAMQEHDRKAAAIAANIQEVERQYETEKANLGDCGADVDECAKRLAADFEALRKSRRR